MLLASLIIIKFFGFFKFVRPQIPPSHKWDYSKCNNASFPQFLFQALTQMKGAWKMVFSVYNTELQKKYVNYLIKKKFFITDPGTGSENPESWPNLERNLT